MWERISSCAAFSRMPMAKAAASNVPHLPMSPASKPRQTSGTRARGLCPNISRATLPGKNRWAEHCPCYAIAPNLRNRRRSNRHLVLELRGRRPREDCALHRRH